MAGAKDHRRRIRGSALAAVLVVLAPAAAGADVPHTDIVSAGPLTHIAIGDELSCQVARSGDEGFELFPSGTAPGDCGTFLAAGPVLYGPDFRAHDGTATTGSIGHVTPFTPVSRSAVTGDGSAANPLTVTTVADAGRSGARITQVDTYVLGGDAYRTDVRVTNSGSAALTGVLYRAGDCYLQPDDTGYGFVDPAAGAAGCSATPDNAPAGRIEQWYPLTPGASFLEARFTTLWKQVATLAPFPDTCECGTTVDNAAGISWPLALVPGASATFSHVTTFSPAGAAGAPAAPAPPAPPAAPPPVPVPTPRKVAATTAQTLVLPRARGCVRRDDLVIRFVRTEGVVLESARVTVRGRTMPLRVLGRRRRTLSAVDLDHRRVIARVDLRGLAAGRFGLTVRTVTATHRAITLTRVYRRCAVPPGVPPPR